MKDEWVDVGFRVSKPIHEAWKALVGRKGKQMVVASASLLMYVRASEAERRENRGLIPRIQDGEVSVEGIVAETVTLREQLDSMTRRLTALEAQAQLQEAAERAVAARKGSRAKRRTG